MARTHTARSHSRAPAAKAAVRATFWGVRDSIAAPGVATLRFGGNTACIEVTAGNDTFVFETGTGARELGRVMLARAPLTLHLLFSDYRWDHIQGFPFFTPVYVPTSQIHVYGPLVRGEGVREKLAAQMKFPVFPIQLEHLNANFTWNDVSEPRRFQAGKATLEALPVGDSVAWRIDYPSFTSGAAAGGRRLVYLPEPTRHVSLTERAEFCEGASLIIYDGSVNNGLNGRHTAAVRAAWDEAIALARAAKAKRVAVFHHSPIDDDRAIEALQRRAKKSFAGALAASEGMTLRL